MARKNFLDMAQFCQRMKEQGLAAVIAASPNAVFHTSGCLIITHNPIRDRLAFCITTAEGRQCLVVCTIEVSLCEHDSWVKDIRGYVEFKELPTHLLAKTLTELGLSNKTVGIDLDYLRESYFRELTEAAPNVNFVAADGLLDEIREVKSDGQIALMRDAAVGSEAAIADLLQEPLTGQSERQVRARLRRTLADRGADGSYLVVAAGPNVVVPGHRAGDHVLAAGEPLVIDAAVTYDGYVAEAAASCVLGAVAATAAETALNSVYRAGAYALRAGRRAGDVFAAAEAGARKAGGVLIGDTVGYGLSFGGKEPPFLARNSAEALKSGMTVALDVTYQHSGGPMLRRKQTWVLAADRARELSG